MIVLGIELGPIRIVNQVLLRVCGSIVVGPVWSGFLEQCLHRMVNSWTVNLIEVHALKVWVELGLRARLLYGKSLFLTLTIHLVDWHVIKRH